MFPLAKESHVAKPNFTGKFPLVGERRNVAIKHWVGTVMLVSLYVGQKELEPTIQSAHLPTPFTF
jgi:hypothetical protein